jgi:hypothetical protein
MIINEEKLFESIGTIDVSLIRRSEQAVRTCKFAKWGSVAAVLVLVASMAALYIRGNMVSTSSTSTSDAAARIVEIDNGGEESDGTSKYDTATKKETAEVETENKISSQSQTSGSASSASSSTANDLADDIGGTDIPVDESTYSEARKYSDELTDLQNRISTAMANGELPFVIESAIYENPDRLHVVVTTDDEDLINKLKSYDTTGELLEIEYRSSNDISDLPAYLK